MRDPSPSLPRPDSPGSPEGGVALSREPLDNELLERETLVSSELSPEWIRLLKDRDLTFWRWLPDSGDLNAYGAAPCRSREDWENRIHGSDRGKVEAALGMIRRSHSEETSLRYRFRLPGRNGFKTVIHTFRSGEDHRQPIVTGLIAPAGEAAVPDRGEASAKTETAAWESLLAAAAENPDLLSHFPPLRSALAATGVFLVEWTGEKQIGAVIASATIGENGHRPRGREWLEQLSKEVDFASDDYRKGALLEGHPTLPDTRDTLFIRSLASGTGSDGTLFLASYRSRAEADEHSGPLFLSSSFLLQSLALQEERKQRENIEAMLHQSQRLTSVGRLANGVAHDFNNLLTVIQGHASFVETFVEKAGDQKVLESVHLLRNATEQAVDLTRQLLLFSRKQSVEFEECDLNKVVAEFAKMMRRMVEENIEFELELDDSVGMIEADRGMIGQILMNLIVNARDAMPKGGTIRIRTEMTHLEGDGGRLDAGDYIALTVSDSGTGIAAEHLARIFDPFFSTKEKGKGTGLGLANVAAIMCQHGGQIDVSSTPGRGTEFEMLFPQTAPRPKTDGKSRKRVPEKPLLPEDSESIRGSKVLLVEDESAVRKLVRKLLEMHGCEVIEAESGKRALDLWPEVCDEISIVVTDIIMPEGVSGWDLARELHKRSPDLGILLTSGYNERPEDHGLGDVDQIAFLQKPYEAANLKRNIYQLLQPVATG